MADGFGFGGNTLCVAGFLPLSFNPVQIPLPISAAAAALVGGVARITITAPSGEDMYVGPFGAVLHRIPANTSQWFTVRGQLWAATSPNSNSSLSSNSSSSSSSATSTSSMTYLYEWN